jgi:hypothetical protein
MLRSVFLWHSLVAGGAGLLFLLAPEAINQAVSPGRVMSIEEKLAIKSFASFVIIIALVAHHAADFPLEAQLSVARSYLVGLVCVFYLYTYDVIHEVVKSDGTSIYHTGVAIAGSVTFFVLTAAYSIALYTDSRKESLKLA